MVAIYYAFMVHLLIIFIVHNNKEEASLNVPGRMNKRTSLTSCTALNCVINVCFNKTENKFYSVLFQLV